MTRILPRLALSAFLLLVACTEAEVVDDSTGVIWKRIGSFDLVAEIELSDGTRCAVYDGDRSGGRQLRQKTRYDQPENRLIIDGRLCCLICCQPYANHPISQSCWREAART